MRKDHHGNRHGRSETARESVLQAADNLLVEKGFAGVTIEGIAQRAGVAKQTIYRWWKSKTEVLLDAFADDAAVALKPADEGELEADLQLHLRKLARFLTRSDAGAVLQALAGEALHDPAVAKRLRSDHLARQRTLDRIPLERAVARGELSAEIDLELAVDELVGPVYYRALITGQPVPPSFTDALVARFLRRR